MIDPHEKIAARIPDARRAGPKVMDGSGRRFLRLVPLQRSAWISLQTCLSLLCRGARRPKTDAPLQAATAKPRRLTRWERIYAGSRLGLAGALTGGVGVFLSSNQAGTTAILLVGAVFLLISVQGTRILKASKDSVEMERELEARIYTEQAVKAVEQKKDPELGAEMAAATQRANPSLAQEPSFQYLNHQIYQAAGLRGGSPRVSASDYERADRACSRIDLHI